MKPLLRTLLVINAILVALAGLMFMLSPWLPSIVPLAAYAASPAMIGQLLGVALLGIAWLQARAVANGVLTASVARVTGLTQAVAAIVQLMWLIAVHQPELSGNALYGAGIAGGVFLLLGLLQSRLGMAVEYQDRAQMAGTVSATRAQARAEQAAIDRPLEPGLRRAPERVIGASPVDDPRYQPYSAYGAPVGEPLADPAVRRDAERRDEGSLPH